MTIAKLIRKKISLRILVSLLILSVMLISVTGYDISRAYQTLFKNLTSLKEEISTFVISQSIINNESSISGKLDELGKKYNFQIVWNKSATLVDKDKRTWIFPLYFEYGFPVIGIDKIHFGTVVIKGTLITHSDILYELIVRLVLLFLALSLIFILLYPLIKTIPEEIFVNPIFELFFLLKKGTNIEITENDTKSPIEILEIKKTILDLLQSARLRAKEVLVNKIAAQVVHDIRSPLATINIATHDISEMPEHKRLLIKGAAERINEIANNLLSQCRDSPNAFKTDILEQSEALSSELVFIAIDTVVSEKQYEYKHMPVKIEFTITDSAYHLFSKIHLSSFKRVLSNLINNGVEATNFSGSVHVNLSADSQSIKVIIKDNGCGISSEILPRITEQGFSYKKTGGTGFGLSYVKQKIELFSGKIHIDSTVGVGTTITLNLPISKPPSWFCEVISLKNNIIILDDDSSIHSAWNLKFKEHTQIKLNHLLKTQEMFHDDTALYLIDHELEKGKKAGLDLINELNITKQSILVTSSFEEPAIRQRCETLGVRIIPKPYVPYIQLSVAPCS